MKIFFTTLTFITTILFNCNAQVQLTKANNAYVAGETFTVHKANVVIDIENVLGNRTWDFSNLISLDTVTWQTKVTTDSAGIISGRDNITLFSNTGKNEYYSYSDSDAVTLNNTMQYDWYGRNKIANYPLIIGNKRNLINNLSIAKSQYFTYKSTDTLILPNKTYYNVATVKYNIEWWFRDYCTSNGHEEHIHNALFWYIPNVSFPIAIASNDFMLNFSHCSEYKNYTFYYQSNVVNVGVENLDVSVLHVNIYPNPANHTLNVYAPQATLLKIYNVLGEEVQSTTTNNYSTVLDISNLPNGIYLLKTNTGQVAKFIKE